MSEGEESLGVGVALPDTVEVGGGEVDGFSCGDGGGEIMEDAVAEIDGVVEAEEAGGGVVFSAVELEDPFASEARPGVFADGGWWGGFGASAGGR